MTKKFNPKNYLGKDRIFVSVPHAPRITRIWLWDAKHSEYRVPDNRKSYMARRWETDSRGDKKRCYRCSWTLEEARAWQGGDEIDSPSAGSPAPATKGGPIFRDIVEEWKRRCFPGIEVSTQISYTNLLRLYFGKLMDLTIYEITPERIDEWLDDLKDSESWTMQSKKRTTFKNELKLLTTIMNYYDDYHDNDQEFRFPLKKRHRKLVKLNRRKIRPKDIKEEEFLLFRDVLKSLYFKDEFKSRGEIMAALATVQYYQAYRISEAAALHWEDVYLDTRNPVNSRLRVVRAVFWPRRKDLQSYVKEGFKNDDSNDGVKDHPMFPETFEVLSSLYHPGAKGLIFQTDGKHLEYRAIQSAFDRSFKRVALPYRGTHIMRHGGCQRVYNQEGGDLAVAQQLLGNSDLKSTLVYAKRNASALTEVAQRHWTKKNLRVVTSGD